MLWAADVLVCPIGSALLECGRPGGLLATTLMSKPPYEGSGHAGVPTYQTSLYRQVDVE
jgi:hypothetical protein